MFFVLDEGEVCSYARDPSSSKKSHQFPAILHMNFSFSGPLINVLYTGVVCTCYPQSQHKVHRPTKSTDQILLVYL